jgi:hypothetical protein
MSNKLQTLDQIEIEIGSPGDLIKVFVDVYDHALSRKWLQALNDLLSQGYHLEKNYCFLGFADSPRNAEYLIQQINASIKAINDAKLGYEINDLFTVENAFATSLCQRAAKGQYALETNKELFNHLHRHFEELQGTNGDLSAYYVKADFKIRWHIRQLNLLCHEFESWALSYRKKHTLPEWQRPSQLMCWLNAPRFKLDQNDFEMFGISTINRSMGGVYVGVNKSVSKHHWEVFVDEADYDPDMVIEDLTTTVMRSQCEAAGDFDIEWARNPAEYDWQKKHLSDFRRWLINNGFDPEDKSLTIGHPQCGQVDLVKSFGTDQYQDIWQILAEHANVWSIKTGDNRAVYDYHWQDHDYADLQIEKLNHL